MSFTSILYLLCFRLSSSKKSVHVTVQMATVGLIVKVSVMILSGYALDTVIMDPSIIQFTYLVQGVLSAVIVPVLVSVLHLNEVSTRVRGYF